MRRIALVLATAVGGAAALGGDRASADAEDRLVVTTPEEGAVVARTFEVTGEAATSAPQGAILRIAGKDVPVAEGRFATTVTVDRDGPAQVRVLFARPGLPATVVDRTVAVDGTPPTIHVFDPSEDVGWYDTDEAQVAFRAWDEHLASVTANGKPVKPERGRDYAVTFLLPASGEVTVRIEAVDTVGNAAVANRTLKRGQGGFPTPPSGQAGPLVEPSGSFASRGTKPNLEPKPATAVAIALGLRWLAAHQAPDGHWEAADFGRRCVGKPVPAPSAEGRGKEVYDAGVTGLALLAFLGAGIPPPYARTVSDGLRWLESVQDREGCVGPRSTGHFVYAHAIGALALVEAYGVTRNPVYLRAAQLALDFTAIARNPYFAWRYGVKPGDNDTSVTTWMAMALAAAKQVLLVGTEAGKRPVLIVDEDAFDGVKTWVDKVTDPESGRVGYQLRGSGPARPTELVDAFPQERSESMTAAGMLCRFLIGENPKTSDPIRKGAALCRRLLPVWDRAGGSIDLYYWHYATQAMWRLGGDDWKAWWRALEPALVDNQRKDGDECTVSGSWDPADPWGSDGGRVYMTALAVRTLETPNLYAK